MEKVLTSSKAELSTDVSAAKERLKYLKQFFFSEITRRVLRGLKFEDKLMFIVRLAQISTQESTQMQLNDQEIDLLLKGENSYTLYVCISCVLFLATGGAPIISESSNTIIQKLKDSLPDQRIDEACAKRILALSLVRRRSSSSSSSDAIVVVIVTAVVFMIVTCHDVLICTGSRIFEHRSNSLHGASAMDRIHGP